MLGFTPLAKQTLADAPTRQTLAAAAGSYALTGTAATLRHGWVVTAASGSYALTGQTANVKHGWVVTAASGSYALTGIAATLRHGWVTTAAAGSYALTGTAATLRHGWVVTAASGSYALTGSAAGVLHGWRLTAGAGSYALAGTDAALVKSTAAAKVLTALSGSYLLTGTDATLVKSTVANQNTSPRGGGGAPIWPGAFEALFKKKKPKKQEIVHEVAEVVEQAIPAITHDESKLIAARLMAQITIDQLRQYQTLEAFMRRVEFELAEMDDEEVLLLAA